VKPYVYLSAGESRDLTRRIGGGAHVSFNGTGDGSRSLSVYVDDRGIWDVEHSPGPAHGGDRVQVARGCLPGEFSERFGDPVQVVIDPLERAVDLSEIRRKVEAFDRIKAVLGEAGLDHSTLAKVRLECLREALRAECISYGELAELQSLAEHIEPGDVELLEPAGVPEFDEDGASA
jgi:hypothetical protein